MRSIRSKLTLLTALAMLVATVSITLIACINVRQNAYHQANLEIEQVASGESRFIASWLASRKQAVNAALHHTNEQPAQGSAYLAQLAEAGGFSITYIGDGSDQSMVYSVAGMTKPNAEYNPAARPWYIQAKGSQDAVVTEPYPDAQESHKGQLVVTIARKVPGQEKVAGGDIYLDALEKSVLSVKLAGQGHAFLLTRDGKVIVHPKPGFGLKPVNEVIPALDPASVKGLADSGEVKTVSYDGNDFLVRLSPIEGADWILGVAVDKSEVDAPLNHLILVIVLAAAVVLAVVLVASSAYLRRQLAGLLRVRDAMTEISQGEGDLTRRIEVSGNDEVAETAEAFNSFVQRLNGMFRELREEAVSLANGVIEVSSTVERVAHDSHRLADISSSNAAAIEQVTVSISHIADTAQMTDQLIKETGQASTASAGDMQRISEEMSRTSQTVGNLASLLKSLEQRSQDITKITNVIRDIADQTNLLALNAAIEAARAGEQGRGFAVVADEVRKLAERTGQATVEISGTVESILAETGRAVSNMQGTVGAVDTSASLTESARERMAQIGETMQQVIDKISAIALSTGEQHNAATAMAQSTESINGRIVDSDAALQSAMQTLEVLNRTAKTMQTAFSRFKL